MSVSYNLAYASFSVYYRKRHLFLHFIVVEKYYFIFREKNKSKNMIAKPMDFTFPVNNYVRH